MFVCFFLKKENKWWRPNRNPHLLCQYWTTVKYTAQLLPIHYIQIRYSFQLSARYPTCLLCWRDEHGCHSRLHSPSLLGYLTAKRRAVGGVAGEQSRGKAQFPHPSLFLIVSWNLDQRSSGTKHSHTTVVAIFTCLSPCGGQSRRSFVCFPA